jgi:hypothetical protein
MTFQLSIKYGTPDPMDHTTKLTPSPGLDAVETLKAVQGVIGAFLSKGALGEKGSIPTPEPSPKFWKGEDGGRAAVMREGADQMKEIAATIIRAGRELDQVNRELGGINKTSTTTPTLASDSECRSEPDNQKTVDPNTTNHSTNEMGSNESPIPMASQANGIRSDDGKNKSRTANLDQHHLRDLADEISRNVSLAATDDAARIKTATAALELANIVRPPVDTIMGWFANMSIVSAVRLFQHWNAFAAIPSNPGESISYSDLASKTNTDEGLLSTSPFPVPHLILAPKIQN